MAILHGVAIFAQKRVCVPRGNNLQMNQQVQTLGKFSKIFEAVAEGMRTLFKSRS